jgi:hypothetical protein
MKVVCIDNKGISDWMTIGKIYDVIKIDSDNDYWVINDYGKENWYYEYCFKPLSEYRIEMINKLLKDESKMF